MTEEQGKCTCKFNAISGDQSKSDKNRFKSSGEDCMSQVNSSSPNNFCKNHCKVHTNACKRCNISQTNTSESCSSCGSGCKSDAEYCESEKKYPKSSFESCKKCRLGNRNSFDSCKSCRKKILKRNARREFYSADIEWLPLGCLKDKS